MERQVYTFEYIIWYTNYVLDPSPENKKWGILFRKRFRMPYNAFLDLNQQCRSSDCFKQWTSGGTIRNFNKKLITPLPLLLLCALQYLGRGWTFDNLQESTAINSETIRIFIHKFIEFGSTTLYKNICTKSYPSNRYI